jgi:hypothetical protein
MEMSKEINFNNPFSIHPDKKIGILEAAEISDCLFTACSSVAFTRGVYRELELRG